MMTTRTTGGAAARVSAWRTRGGERRARVVARMTTGENVSEPVEKNGCDVRRGRALESGSNGNEDRGARTDDKRQSRWSSEFWDELEFDVMEPWMMQEDDTRGDGFLRSESLLSPSWRLMLLSDGSVTVRVRVPRLDASTDPTRFSRAASLEASHRPRRRHDRCLMARQHRRERTALSRRRRHRRRLQTSSRRRRRLSPPPTRGRPLRRLRRPSLLRRELVEPERLPRHHPRRRRRKRIRRPRPSRLAQTRRDENRALPRGAPRLPRRLPRARRRLGLTRRHHFLGAPLHLLVSPPPLMRDPRGDESETRTLPRPARVRVSPPPLITPSCNRKQSLTDDSIIHHGRFTNPRRVPSREG